MKAFKIDVDGVTELNGERREILDPEMTWDYASISDTHDVVVEDGSLFTSTAFATIGPLKHIPLPAFIFGLHKGETVDATLDIDEVRAMFALEGFLVNLTD